MDADNRRSAAVVSRHNIGMFPFARFFFLLGVRLDRTLFSAAALVAMTTTSPRVPLALPDTPVMTALPTTTTTTTPQITTTKENPAEVSLSARVLKMGMTQLLDVILHSRERLDVKAWEFLLQRALATSPEMCRYGRGGAREVVLVVRRTGGGR